MGMRMTCIHHIMYKTIKAMVGVTIVLGIYKTNLKPHKYLCKQYNHSTLNNFCKRSFPQKDLVWRLEHIFIVLKNSTTSATWCYFYNPHTFSILKSIHFICTIECDHRWKGHIFISYSTGKI